MLKTMPRERTPSQKEVYRNITLGRCPGYRWAAWHATAGWVDAGASILDAKAYVDYILNDPGSDSDSED